MEEKWIFGKGREANPRFHRDFFLGRYNGKNWRECHPQHSLMWEIIRWISIYLIQAVVNLEMAETAAQYLNQV